MVRETGFGEVGEYGQKKTPLARSAHHLSRVENRMQILAYYVNNSDTKYVSSGIKLIEE